jgi:excisionase family DNA binding protein
MEETLTPHEVAAILKISVPRVHELVRFGKLACIQVNGRVRRFTSDQVADFIEARTLRRSVAPLVSVAPSASRVVRSAPEKRAEPRDSPEGQTSDSRQIRKEIGELWR